MEHLHERPFEMASLPVMLSLLNQGILLRRANRASSGFAAEGILPRHSPPLVSPFIAHEYLLNLQQCRAGHVDAPTV